MTMKWVQRESLLQQSGHATGTKFYQAGIAHDDIVDKWFLMFNWGGGTPVLDFSSNQTQCGGVFLNLMAAQAASNRQLNAKTRRGYNPYNGSDDQTTVLPRIASIARAADTTATPVPTPAPEPESETTDEKVAYFMSLPTLDAGAAQVMLALRQSLLDGKEQLLCQLDIIDSQVELLNAKLIS